MFRLILIVALAVVSVPNLTFAQFDIPRFSLTSAGGMDSMFLVQVNGQVGTPPVPYYDIMPIMTSFSGKNGTPELFSEDRTYPTGNFIVGVNYDEQSVVNVGGIYNFGVLPGTDDYHCGFEGWTTWTIYDPLNYSSTNDATFDLVLDFGGVATPGTTCDYKFGIAIITPDNTRHDGVVTYTEDGVFLTGLEEFGVEEFELSTEDLGENEFSMGARIPFTVPLNSRITLRTGLDVTYQYTPTGPGSSQSIGSYTATLEGKTLVVD